jgi:hypothetical protein
MKNYIKWVLLLGIAFIELRFVAPFLVSKPDDISLMAGILSVLLLPIVLVGIYKLMENK